MKNPITSENINLYAYSNDHLIKGEIRGIVLALFGLGFKSMIKQDPPEAFEYAENGIMYVVPYYNPWCWMNEQAVDYVDSVVAAICEKHGLGENVRICATGQSMGGLCALVYTKYARITPAGCVVNCPVCDLVYHIGEREDLPRTLYSAFCYYDGTIEEALAAHSPYHLADTMPDVPYAIFHCEQDKSVNLQMHSERFYEKMKATHDITLTTVPYRGHCDLSHEAWIEYFKAVKKVIG